MPEELRIVVVDQGGPSGGRAAPGGGGPTAKAGGRSTRGPVAGPQAFPALRARGPAAGPQASPALRAPGATPAPGPRAVVGADGSRRALSAVGAAGGVAGAAAAGNVAGAASGASAGIVAAVGGPVGVAVAAVAAGFGVAAIAARKFAQVIESQTSKLAGFSAPLSLAQSQTEISRELALMRRAQRIGPELAAAERLRSKFEDAMTDLGTEILGVLLKLLDAATPFIEVGIKVLTIFAAFLEKWGDVIVKAMIVLARMSPIVSILELIFKLLEQIFGAIIPDDDPVVDPRATELMNLLPRNARGQTQFFQPIPGV